MKRMLLPLAVASATAAAVIGGSSAVAHPGSAAHSAAAAKIQLKKAGHLGKVLTNGHGQVLYLFEKDRHGKSACYGQCAKFWPPALTTGKPLAGKGVSASKLGTTRRKDGRTQVTYKGHPLYAFLEDRKPGQASGQGSKAFGAAWYVLGAKGNTITR
jgi:predicted lipoprotein with Yx(FWY)xxD motif